MLYTNLDSLIGELPAARRRAGPPWPLHAGGRTAITVRPEWQREDEPFAAVRTQLDEYWDGTRRDFDVPLTMHGSSFQQRAWRALQEIPYGETISYGEQARRIGPAADPRAVGQANGRNPIAVIVPCHRVIVPTEA